MGGKERRLGGAEAGIPQGPGESQGVNNQRLPHEQAPHSGGINKPELHPPQVLQNLQTQMGARENVPPVDSGQSWYLKEGELTPDQLRNLGYLIYTIIFSDLAILENLYEQGGGEARSGTGKEIDSLPGEAYIDGFAKKFGLNAKVLKRWVNTASIELASTLLPLLTEEREDAAQGHLAPDSGLTLKGIDRALQIATRVAHTGIKATIDDHLGLISNAQYRGILMQIDYPKLSELS